MLWKAPKIITYARDGVRGAEEISVQLDTDPLRAADFTTLTDAVVHGKLAQIGRSGMGSVISATTKDGVRFDLVGPENLSDERLIALAEGVRA